MVLARPSDVKASDTKNKDGVNIDAEEQAWARQAESYTEPPERTKPGVKGVNTAGCSRRRAPTRKGGRWNWNEVPPGGTEIFFPPSNEALLKDAQLDLLVKRQNACLGGIPYKMTHWQPA